MRSSIRRRFLALAAALVALLVLGVGYDRDGVSGARDLSLDDPATGPTAPATVSGRVEAPSAATPVRFPDDHRSPMRSLARPPDPPSSRRPAASPPVRPSRPTPRAAPQRDRRPPAPAVLRPVRLPPPPTLDFVVSSFNVLGASHTAERGKRPGMASGRVRAGWAAALIRRHDAEVIGFQELQGSQLAVLQRRTDLDFYPGFALSAQDTENSIGWRRTRWAAVERHVVRIPYFDGGLRAMPVVRLRHRSTGIEAWFANFHNPADTARFPRQERYRLQATRIETRLVNQLVHRTGLPVFVTGDMNERASFFCRFTGRTSMLAARGGSNNGRCQAGRPRAVDWIFASPGVAFTRYVEDRSRLVDITTDHPVIVARARLTGTGLED